MSYLDARAREILKEGLTRAESRALLRKSWLISGRSGGEVRLAERMENRGMIESEDREHPREFTRTKLGQRILDLQETSTKNATSSAAGTKEEIMSKKNTRQPPPRMGSTSTTSASTSEGPISNGTANGAAATKPKKPRKSEDQREAELEAQLAAVRERKALKKIAENKPLAAAVKASGKLRKWLPPELAAQVDAHMKRLVAANASSPGPHDTATGNEIDAGDPSDWADAAAGGDA